MAEPLMFFPVSIAEMQDVFSRPANQPTSTVGAIAKHSPFPRPAMLVLHPLLALTGEPGRLLTDLPCQMEVCILTIINFLNLIFHEL